MAPNTVSERCGLACLVELGKDVTVRARDAGQQILQQTLLPCQSVI